MHQHVHIDDKIFVPFMDALRRLPLGDCQGKLLPYGAWGFRQRWDVVLDELGLTRGHAHGLVPASLRAGGTTHLFLTTQDISLVKRRGRWVSDRTLEHYLQEMGAASLLASVADATRRRISVYASRTRLLLELITIAAQPLPDRLLEASSLQQKRK